MKTAAICPKPWDNFLVQVNGDCYFCCFALRPGGRLGSLKKKDFEAIWTSRKANHIRRSFTRGKIPYICQTCPYFGEFKHEKSRAYGLFFLARKRLDNLMDFFGHGFSGHRLKRFLSKVFRSQAKP